MSLLHATILWPPRALFGCAQTVPFEDDARYRVELAAGEKAEGKRAPLSLTASDGTGLKLASLSLRAAVEDPLALTELHLVFENPELQTLEGNFKIQLPPGAALSRFAMRTNDGWQEAEVVEKKAARRAYEDFLHRKQDPALLEQAPGNEFSARVFPIRGGERKELIVTYSQTLEQGEAYTFPLDGLPEVEVLDLQVFVAGKPVATAHRARFLPGGDFTVRSDRFARAGGVRAGEYVLTRFVPFTEAKRDPLEAAVLLVDTSASRALGFGAQTQLVERLVGSLPASSRVQVVAFDQDVSTIFDGAASAYGPAQSEALLVRGALGASNLSAALRALPELAPTATRLVLVGDGVATAGETDAQKLRGHVESLQRTALTRFDAIVLGGLRDEPTLRALVRGGLARDGVVLDAKLGFEEVRRRLDLATYSRVPITMPGASWVYPERLDGVQAGDEVQVFAQVPVGVVPRVVVGGRPAETPSLRAVDAHLLERAWAAAKIQSLSEAPPEGDAALAQHEIVSLSRRHRVLSPFTSLLALETDADYKRSDIDRTAKLDVLTVRAGRVDVDHRSRQPEVAATDPSDRASAAENAPTAPWGREVAELGMVGRLSVGADGTGSNAESLGGQAPPREADSVDSTSARGNMWGEAMGEGFGAGGLGLVGTGSGGGGRSAPGRRGSGLSGWADLEGAVPERGPYTGTFADVMADLGTDKTARALGKAVAWQRQSPGDAMALLALGEAHEAAGDRVQAARAYGSILELFSFRADSRRFAGERLERLGTASAFELASDAYRGAVADRPDHPSGARLLAYSLVRDGSLAEAFVVLEEAVKRSYPAGRYAGALRILEEDLVLVGMAWGNAEPNRKPEIEERWKALSVDPREERAPSVRFVLVWETDANDVDFHIEDGHGNRAFYGNPELPSGGGSLYADVTTGYGPECFTVRGTAAARAYPYKLSAHYYSRGPMGYGMGKLQVLEHDGQGGLRFEERPFVIMRDGAFVDLGVVKAPLGPARLPVAVSSSSALAAAR